jgi:hypothetical protein
MQAIEQQQQQQQPEGPDEKAILLSLTGTGITANLTRSSA